MLFEKTSILFMVFLSSLANLITNEHDELIQKSICTKESEKVIGKHYTTISLKCDWQKFVDNRINNDLNVKMNYDDSIFYDIHFYLSNVSLNQPKYKVLNQNIFYNLILKSLTMRNLNLERIDELAFDKVSFGHLTKLDIGFNNLKKLKPDLFKNLGLLEKLDISSNQLVLTDENFKYCKHLKSINISNNHLQYLNSKLFNGLNRLEFIDLTNNNIDRIEECTFSHINTNPISVKFAPPSIDLKNNPINCDCSLFYTNRFLGIRVNATCSMPNYYKGKHFTDLKYEDPSYKCHYDSISSTCSIKKIQTRELILSIVLSSIILIVMICACCCLCKNISLSWQITRLRDSLRKMDKNNQAFNDIYNTHHYHQYKTLEKDNTPLI